MTRTVSITTLGCKTNQFESAALEEQLRGAGYQVVPFEEGAELVIVNTCSVTAATDAQSRNLIRRARRLNLSSRIIVTGCYAQVDPETLRAIPGVAVVLGNDEKKDLLRYLANPPDQAVVAVGDIRRSAPGVALPLSGFAERSRAFVQIQNGCDAFCSFCIIPYARGSSRSLSPDQVVEQVRRLTGAGYREVVLTGIHIGGYGKDLRPATSLLGLIRRLEAEPGEWRLRLGSIEPTEIPLELVELMASSRRLCHHFHIPLQAGDDAVLRRMNRRYDTGDFYRLIEGIHHRLPEAAIGLDVIAGFPGETEAEFENTLRLLESLPVSHLHVFPYSRRPGTPAATMPDQVPAEVGRQRAARLRALGEEKNRLFAEWFVGRTLEVIVEGGSEEGDRRGLSRPYLPVIFPGQETQEREFAAVRIAGWTPAGLRGTLA